MGVCCEYLFLNSNPDLLHQNLEKWCLRTCVLEILSWGLLYTLKFKTHISEVWWNLFQFTSINYKCLSILDCLAQLNKSQRDTGKKIDILPDGVSAAACFVQCGREAHMHIEKSVAQFEIGKENEWIIGIFLEKSALNWVLEDEHELVRGGWKNEF